MVYTLPTRCIYASLSLRFNPGFGSWFNLGLESVGFYTFNTEVEQERVLSDKRCLSHPQNNPLPGQKQHQKDEEPRHRKHLCTRTLRIL